MQRLSLAILGLCATFPASALDDEAWIERHMQGVRIVEAPAPIVQRSAPKDLPVALSDLSKHIGQEVTFVLDTGRERRGTIRSVDANNVTIVTKLHGGRAELEVPRASIKSASRR
jgi:hypothetical protein